MGTEFNLLKPSKKEYFELGKGLWETIFNTKRCNDDDVILRSDWEYDTCSIIIVDEQKYKMTGTRYKYDDKDDGVKLDKFDILAGL